MNEELEPYADPKDISHMDTGIPGYKVPVHNSVLRLKPKATQDDRKSPKSSTSRRDIQFEGSAKDLWEHIIQVGIDGYHGDLEAMEGGYELLITRKLYDFAMHIASKITGFPKDGVILDLIPDMPELDVRINRLDGSCPVQATGTIDGHSAFYFRGRHEKWQFIAGPKELSTDDLVRVQLKMTEDPRVFILEGDDEDRDYQDYDHVRKVLQDYAQQYVEWMNERMNEMDKELKAKLGEPLDFTDEELEQMAEVKPHDVKVAVKLWENAAPAPFKRLLSAKVEEENA